MSDLRAIAEAVEGRSEWYDASRAFYSIAGRDLRHIAAWSPDRALAALDVKDVAAEMLAHIQAYEEAIGHSYCHLNVGGGWAPEPAECTCGHEQRLGRWRAALDRWDALNPEADRA